MRRTETEDNSNAIRRWGMKFAFSRVRSHFVAVAEAGVLLLIGVGLAAAQGNDTIEVSFSAFQQECQLANDTGPGIRTVYVRHTFSPGSLASRFRITLDPGVEMTYLSEAHPFPMTIGNTQDGISVCYGGCTESGAFVVATITYMYQSSSVSCPRLRVAAHPDAETVEVVNCYGVPEVAWAQDMYVLTPGGICGCPDPHRSAGSPGAFACEPVLVEKHTWGAVKALYRR